MAAPLGAYAGRRSGVVPLTPEQKAALDRAARAASPAQSAAIARAQQAAQSDPMQRGLSQLSAMSRNPQVQSPQVDGQQRGLPKPGIVERAVDNVFGIDNGYRSAGEVAAAALNKGGESMTLGLVGDEAAGAFDAAIRRPNGMTTEEYRQQEQDLQEQNPGVAFAAEVAPAFLPGAGAAGLAARASGVIGKGATAATLGGAAGATYGFMEGEGDGRLTNAAATGALGALFGFGGSKAIDALSGVPRAVKTLFNRTDQRPTVESLKALKTAAYRAVEQSGEVFDGDTMTALSSRVRQIAADDVGYVPGEDTAVDAAIKTLTNREGIETTLPQLDRIRQRLWSRVSRNPDQVQIYDFISAIDEAIESRAGSSDLMAAARAANARFAKSQLLEDAFTKAADQTASTGSGGNILNKYRQAVTSIINNPRQARFFSGEEIDMMRRFVRGDFSENAMRLLGKLSPSGNGLMMALHTIGGVASQGASVPLMAVGAGAKAAADRSVTRGARQVQDALSGYRPVPQVPQLSAPAAGAVTLTSPLAASALER